MSVPFEWRPKHVKSNAIVFAKEVQTVGVRAGQMSRVDSARVRDEETIAAADEHGLAMVFTGVRHFRH